MIFYNRGTIDFKRISKLLGKLFRTKTRKTVHSGHCTFNRHMCNITLGEDVTCRFCQEKEKNTEHILYYCEGLDRLRLPQIGEKTLREIAIPKNSHQSYSA